MKYLNGGTLISPSDILDAKIRVKLSGDNSYYETDFKSFFSKKSTEILEAIIDEQLFAHLKTLHSTLTYLKENFAADDKSIIEFLLPDSILPLNALQDILPTDDDDM